MLRDVRRKHSFVPVVVRRENLSWEEVSRIEVNINELPGVNIEQGLSRFYPFGDRASHVVGYVSPPAINELTGDPLMELLPGAANYWHLSGCRGTRAAWISI